MDIWDGDEEPCVSHRNILTSKVSVREISKAITKYAFIASPYPVLISAEIHCNIEQQDMVAQIMREEFGDLLVTEPLSGREYEATKGITDLPSPEELKGRILLKVQNLISSSRVVCVLTGRINQAPIIFATNGLPMESMPVTVDVESSDETSTISTSEDEGGRENREPFSFVIKLRIA